MFFMELTYFVLLPLAVVAVLAAIVKERKRQKERFAGLAFCGGVYLLIVIGSLLAMHDAAERLISSLISQNRLPEAYLTGVSRGFDYSTVEGFMMLSLGLGALFFALLAFYHGRRLLPAGVGLLAVYAALILREAAQYPQLALLILIPASVIAVLFGIQLKNRRRPGAGAWRLQ